MAIENNEIQVGKKAARKLQSTIRSIIAVETVKGTGQLMKTSVRAVAEKNTGLLQRLVITSPHYGYKLNYGFIGTKSNNVPMNLAPTKHLYQAIEQTSIIDELANDLSNLRADVFISKIQF